MSIPAAARPRLVLLLLLAAPLLTAGCSDVGESVTPAALKEPARFVVQDVSVSPPSVELGDPVTISVSVRNAGELAGSDTVVIVAGGQTVGTLPLTLEPAATQQRSTQFQPEGSGIVPVVASVGGSVAQSQITIRAPRLSDGSWTYEDLWCADRVPLQVSFRNNGDGNARQVTVKAVIYNENNVAQDDETQQTGHVAPGSAGSASFSLFARDTCGRDDYYYAVVTITPRFGTAHTFQTERFSI